MNTGTSTNNGFANWFFNATQGTPSGVYTSSSSGYGSGLRRPRYPAGRVMRNEEVEVDADDSAKIDEFLGEFAVKK